MEYRENWFWYLLLSIINWIGITYIYRFALEGEINKIVLLIITFIIVGFGLINLGIAESYFKNGNKCKEV